MVKGCWSACGWYLASGQPGHLSAHSSVSMPHFGSVSLDLKACLLAHGMGKEEAPQLGEVGVRAPFAQQCTWTWEQSLRFPGAHLFSRERMLWLGERTPLSREQLPLGLSRERGGISSVERDQPPELCSLLGLPPVCNKALASPASLCFL